MDENGGVNPITQGYDVSQPVQATSVPGAPDFQQQAPMVSSQPAYQPQTATPQQYTQPVVAQPQPVTMPAPQVQTTIQDVRPSWQQELQYNAPENPPWTNQSQTQQSQTSTSTALQDWGRYAAPALNSQVSTEAYSLLTEPVDYSAYEAKPKSKAKRIIIFAVCFIGGLLIIGGVGFVTYTKGVKDGAKAATDAMQEELKKASDQQSSLDNQDQSQSDQIDQTSDSTGNSDSAETIDFTMKTPQYFDETKTGTVGEVVESSDGFVLKVLSVEKNYKPAGSTDSTGTFVKVNLIVGNSDSTKAKSLKPDSFLVTNATGDVAGSFADALISNGKMTMPYEIKSGAQVQFSLVYKITGDQTGLQFIRSQPYIVGGTNRLMIIVLPLDNV